MNPFAATVLVVLCILVLILPRCYAAIPFLICMLFLGNQAEVFFGLHFYLLTVLLIFGIIRLIIRQEFYLHDGGKITLFMILWAIVALITNYFLQGLNGDIVRTRNIFECLMLYVYFKSILRSPDDILLIFKLLPILILPVAFSMAIERFTGYNLFSEYSGIQAISAIRSGAYRCQGPFVHPILAGAFGATVLPAIAALWFQKTYLKLWCILGIISSAIITFTAGSTAAFLTFFLEILALGCWKLRHNIRLVWTGIVAIIVIVSIATKTVPWHFFTLLSNKFGGTGFYRSDLIDAAFGKHFQEWWLKGIRPESTRAWLKTGLEPAKSGHKSVDVTNEFLHQGISGGFFTMALFLIIIYFCFRAIAKSLSRNESSPFSNRIMLWALGCILFGHIAMCMSVSYFDQIIIWYYLLIGMIGAVSAIPLRPAENTMVPA